MIAHIRVEERAGCFTLISSSLCHVAVTVVFIFLKVPQCLQCVIVAFPGHTHLHFSRARRIK